MTRAHGGMVAVGAVVLAGWLLAAGPALASPRHPHEPGPGHPSTAYRPHAGSLAAPGSTGAGADLPATLPPLAPPAPASRPFVLAGTAALALAAIGARPRRAVPAALTLLLSLSTFESGLHGVHHLGDPRDADRCAVLALATHVEAAAGATDPVHVPDPVVAPAPPAPPAPDIRGALLDVPPGRAPPRPSFI